MSFLDRLADLWARFLAWLVGLRMDAAGSKKLPSADRDTLVVLLDEGRPGQRWLAAEALGESDPGRNGVDALATALDSDDPLLRNEAGAALAQIGGRSARGVLIESAASDKPAVQAAVADALGHYPADDTVAAALEQLLESPDALVRQSAAEALARTGWPRERRSTDLRPAPTSRLLTLLAEDTDPMVRRAAALALGRLGDPATREALHARQEDPDEDWRVREAAALAASRLPTVTPATLVVETPPESPEVESQAPPNQPEE